MTIHFIIESLTLEFWVNDFPGVPHKGDLVNPYHLYTKQDEKREILGDHIYVVESMVWGKNEKGDYSIMVFLTPT